MPALPPPGVPLGAAAVSKRGLSDDTIREAASILWGVSLTCAWFALAKVVQHSRSALRRRKQYNIYILLLWSTWLPTLGMSVLTWLRLQAILPDRYVPSRPSRPGTAWLTPRSSFWTFLSISKSPRAHFSAPPSSRRRGAPVVLWSIQLQCVLQIMVNRLSFLIVDRRRSRNLKLVVLGVVGFITMVGGCTWIMAGIRLSPTLVAFSHTFDRVNKGLFAATDLALNAAFMYLVWRKLIAAGLAKYWAIFRYNGCCILLSISLDIILIGVETASSQILYVPTGRWPAPATDPCPDTYNSTPSSTLPSCTSR